ncbi:MAG: DUF2807 domain-containing protein [Bacteroidota bacterium]|nr:DUF2807 domain-containing protein [Bacteroidota bacterium]
MKQLLLLIASSFLFFSCDFMGGERVNGNGNETTENRNVTDFKNVASSAPADVVLTQSPDYKVQVKGDENLLGYIITETDGNTLKIKVKQGYNLRPQKHLEILISAPQFTNISSDGSGNVTSVNTLSNSDKMTFELSGSGNVEAKIDAPSVESHTSGSGDISFSGKTGDASLSVSGSGNIHCLGLTTENASITINGSGNADVYASKQLDIHVNGSGDVRYKGGASVNSHINGSGSVSKAE